MRRKVRERGWPSATFTARIEHRVKRGRDQWRFVIERDFVHSEDVKFSRWRSGKDKTVMLANRWLDNHDHDRGREQPGTEYV